MPPEIIIVPAIFLISGSVVTLRMWLAHKEKMAGLSTASSSPLAGELASRIVRIEQAVDSIAVEVERISEGQRFVTKLLAEPRHQIPERSSGRPAPEPS
jgi:hypothetical protein